MKKLLPLSLLVILIAAGIGFVVFWPSNSDTTSQTQTSQSTENNIPAVSKAVPAIKSYAAKQFNIKEDEVKIVRSEQQQWKDICFDLPIPNYDCSKKAISGYEVVVEIDGNQTTYRGSDDGTAIRIVKTPSASITPSSESSPSAARSPEE